MLRSDPTLCRSARHSSNLVWFAASAATAMLLTFATAANAQNAPPAQATGTPANGGNALQEVTVTAQFVRQSVQATPFAITAISAASLADRGQTSLVQIANDVPSVNLFADEAAFGRKHAGIHVLARGGVTAQEPSDQGYGGSAERGWG
ncbi:MAG: hypothetical protein ACREU3_15810, partial [Steroidobacteraceae bacterium]